MYKQCQLISNNFSLVLVTILYPENLLYCTHFFLNIVCQTVTVGGLDDPSAERSITPTLGNNVQLFCSRPSWVKDWYSTGSKVEEKSEEISTTPGPNRKLEFVNFKTSQVGTYSCILKPESDRKNTTRFQTFTVTLG